jgi:hypothetical protein
VSEQKSFQEDPSDIELIHTGTILVNAYGYDMCTTAGRRKEEVTVVIFNRPPVTEM